jgi:hypothetical protein
MCERENVGMFDVARCNWRESACVLHMCLSTAPRTGHPMHQNCTSTHGTVLLNRGHIIMQSIIDIAMTRK